MLPVNFWAFW